VGHEARIGDMRNAYKLLVRKPEGKIPFEDLGVHERIILERLHDVVLIKKSAGTTLLFTFTVLGVDWIHLAQDRDQWRVLMNTVMNHRLP